MSDAHHSHDYAKANQEHFDKEAQKPGGFEEWADLSRQVGRSLVESHKELFTKETTILDFACGPGTSRPLRALRHALIETPFPRLRRRRDPPARKVDSRRGHQSRHGTCSFL